MLKRLGSKAREYGMDFEAGGGEASEALGNVHRLLFLAAYRLKL
jgi:hypothetical protein